MIARRAIAMIGMAMAMRVVGMMMLVMHCMLDMFGSGPARLAEEGQEDKPPAVEAGQQRGEAAQHEGQRAQFRAAAEGGLQNGVLGIEASKAEHPDHAHASDRQRARSHHPEGNRNMPPQIAVIAHVLFVMHGVND